MHVAVYGSLRTGEYNNRYFDMTSLGLSTLTGFKMYSLGPYPTVVNTGNQEDSIVVEVMEVDANTKKHLDRMEFGAGYDEETVSITIDDSTYTCSIYTFDSAPNDNIVTNGDWSAFNK